MPSPGRFAPALLFASAVLVASAACSSSSSEPDFPDPDVAPAAVNPDGVPYPRDHVGVKQRANGTPGDRLPNFSFQGYVDGNKAGGLKEVSMADYYDPKAAHHKVLIVLAAAVWCSICVATSEDLVPKKAQLESEGAQFLEVVVNGARLNEGPSLNEVNAWIDRNQANYTTAIDVRARRMGQLGLDTVPWSMIVDTRTMEILEAGAGAPADMAKYTRAGITFVDTHPPSY